MRLEASESALSHAQERLWVNHLLDPSGADYNVCLALRLQGRLDTRALGAALTALAARHEPLRTVYTSRDGRPVATVLPPGPVGLDLHRVDGEEGARRLAESRARTPFDLATGPVLRACLAVLGADDHVLILTVHHIAFDEWSMGILLAELDALYQGGELAPLPAAHAEVVAAEREADLDAALGHWRAALDGLAGLDLPTDRAPAAEPSSEGAVITFTVPAPVAAALGAVARRARATPYMTGLAAFTAFLSRYCGQDDIAIGTTVANRALPHSEHLIGAFFNTVVIRGDVSGDPGFTDLLGRTRDACLGALTHQRLPYPMLADGRAPLFRVLYEMHAGVPAGLRLGDLQAEAFEFPDTAAKYDLALSLMPSGGTLVGRLTYRRELFEPGTAQRIADSFLHLLEQLAAAPDTRIGALELLPPGRRAEVLAACGAAPPLGPLDQRLHDLFVRQARRTPQATALSYGSTRLSYRDLDERANRIAHWLRGRGVGRGSVVGVCLERSDWLVAAFLGVWKAGAAYLPLDPGLPAERIGFMVGDSGASFVLRSAPDLEAAVASCPATDPLVPSTPADLAYVIYTSGSTGRPKGVMVPHRGLVNFLHWCVSAYAVGGVGGAPLFSSVAYDMVVPNIYTPLVTGQCVHLLDEDTSLDELREGLSGRPYGFVKLTPGHLEVLAGQLPPAEAARLAGVLVVGADAFPGRALAFWQALDPAPVLLNEYGPTEASVANCVHTVTGPVGGELVPIGRPIPGTTMYVLDAEMRPLPFGVPGELYIGGECVVRGYHGRPALTAERFVPDPYGAPGARLYRTGDLGRLRADGEFEFLGRLDDQVKIRGYRVELGEIEAALDELPGVERSVVVAAPDGAGGRRLVAYVVGAAPPARLRAGLADVLPEYMVPALFVPLPAIPLNRNGKVDRSALPGVVTRPAEQPRHDDPSPLATLVAGLVAEVVGAVDLRPEEDLFTRGLDSLGAVRLLAAVKDRLGATVKLRAFLTDPTLGGLGELIFSGPSRAPERTRPVLVPLAPAPSSSAPPVYCVHPLGGSAHCYAALAARLAPDRPVHGLQALDSGQDTRSLTALAARYADELSQNTPGTLVGWSAGGVLAFETARHLRERGHKTERVLLVDSVPPREMLPELLDDLLELEELIERLEPLGPRAARAALLEREVGFFAGLGLTSEQVGAYYEAYGPGLLRLWRDGLEGLAGYRPARYDGPVTLLVSERNPAWVRTAQISGWRSAATDLTVRIVEGEHHELLRPTHVDRIIPWLT
ncbi:amino acid adenylation domain-containing protein [Nonomuraea sp. NPDC050663]|uniref:amino acid adenylation domain-containing protein n=1 Tax=Nonomuraea sp. NPDC050663 TaxID=3364370 RepID=UPI0037B688D1